jgi:hypothetical protein
MTLTRHVGTRLRSGIVVPTTTEWVPLCTVPHEDPLTGEMVVCRAPEGKGEHHSTGYCDCEVGHIWHCQRIDHFRQHHPGLVESMVRDPYADVPREPVPYILGTVDMDARPADSPKKFF